jgi:phage terminase large subunit GpA-like protein
MSLPWIKPNRAAVWKVACATHEPHQDQTVTEWAEAHIELPLGMTSAPGPFRTTMFPYMVEPLNQFHPNSGTRKMTLIWAAQSNKTTAIMLGIGYRLDRAPAPTLWVMDNSRNAQSFSESRWQRLIDANPVLSRHKPSNALHFLRDRCGIFVHSSLPCKIIIYQPPKLFVSQLFAYAFRILNLQYQINTQF